MIYKRICILAKQKGYSINRLEKEAGLSIGSVCKWGKSVSPTVSSLEKIADLLECTIDSLVRGDEEE